jgi:hypothetical protein
MLKEIYYHYLKILLKIYKGGNCCMLKKIKIFFNKVIENKGKISIGIIILFLLYLAFKIGSCL